MMALTDIQWQKEIWERARANILLETGLDLDAPRPNRIEEGPPEPIFIYFIQIGDFVKIGISARWKRRVANFKTSSPFEVTVLHVELNYPHFEKELHRRFRELHHRGEWFRADADLLRWIDQRSKEFGRSAKHLNRGW